ncbi:MAG: SMP-30/gluconolactonase/LRE family protein [Pseudomonadota bacterium]
MEVQCVLDARAATGESPVWSDVEQVLYWVDIPGQRLHRFDPSSDENQSWDMPAQIGCIAMREAGGLLVALQTGLFAFDPVNGALIQLADSPFDKVAGRFNDGRCDRQGRFWVSSMAEPPEPAVKSGKLYRVDGDLSVRALVSGLVIGNGLAFSPDGRVLYHSDSDTSVRTIWAWDLDPVDGMISNRRIFARTGDQDGVPDGAAVDVDGCYWTAANEGWQLIRYTPQGKIDRTIRLPVRRPTMLAFGGRELDVIFVTSMLPQPGDPPTEQPFAGGLFALSVGIQGLPESRFAG